MVIEQNTETQICSESYCNIHDVGHGLWDEDGKRPVNRGRNPWNGFCLRIDKLNRLRKQIYSHEDKLVEKVAEKPQYKSVPESVVRRIVQEELKGHLFQRDLPQKKSKGGIPL